MLQVERRNISKLYLSVIFAMFFCAFALTACNNTRTLSFDEMTGVPFESVSATYSSSKFQSAEFVCPQSLLSTLDCKYKTASKMDIEFLSDILDDENKDFDAIIRVNTASSYELASYPLIFYIVNDRIYVRTKDSVYISAYSVNVPISAASEKR